MRNKLSEHHTRKHRVRRCPASQKIKMTSTHTCNGSRGLPELCQWERDDWSLHLSTLLSGRALEVYARLPIKQARDFDTLKSALLRWYDLTPDGFRRRFYDARRDADENGTEYLSRTSRYLLRWIELTEIEKTYEAITELR